MSRTIETHVLIVGAGPAGLAVAAGLRPAGVPFRVIEQAEAVGSSWRQHYERLHLHTAKEHSALPGLAMPASYPQFPSRDQVVEYLETYARHHRIDIATGRAALRIQPEGAGGDSRCQTQWRTVTVAGDYLSAHVVIATGYNRVPHRPHWPDENVFRGEVIHSRGYRNGVPYAGRKMLVVGCGNSGAEIATDLVEHGAAAVYLAVRGPVDVTPRLFLGRPLTEFANFNARLPLRVQDRMAALISRLAFGRLETFGLVPSGRTVTRIVREARLPLIDAGTIAQIRAGRIRVVPGIERFTANGVVLDHAWVGPERALAVDAVILATGYRPALTDFLDAAGGAGRELALNISRTQAVSGTEREPPLAMPGLHFVGFSVSPLGMLRQIGVEANRVARAIRPPPQ